MAKKSKLEQNKKTAPMSIADVVKALKADILDAQDQGKGTQLFSIEEASVEIMVAFERTLEIGGGAMKVIPLIPKAAEKSAACHKLTLKLKLLPPELRRLVRSGDGIEENVYLGDGKESQK